MTVIFLASGKIQGAVSDTKSFKNKYCAFRVFVANLNMAVRKIVAK